MATDAYLTAWRRSGRRAAVLVKVQLTKPTSRTLYLSTAEVATPGSPKQVWEGAITKVNRIRAPGSFGSRTLDFCSSSFVLPAGGRLAYQTGSARLLDAFKDYDWQGAAVTIYFWEQSLTSFVDAQQQLPAVVQTYKVEDGAITVFLVQDAGDNREIPEEVVGPDKDPRAPEKSRGRVRPIAIGKLKAVPLRVGPWTAEYGNIATGHNGLQLIAGGRRAVPGVVVDMGRGGDAGGPTKVVFAGHPVKRIGDDTNGTAIWMEQDGKMCRMQPGAQVNNCRCSFGVAAITRPSGNFLTDGVHPGALVANAIAASFPANTRITTVASGSLGTSAPASGTVSVDTVGEFLDLFNNATDGAGLLIGDKPSSGTDPFTTIFVPLLPSNVELVAANNAENPRAVLDPFNDTGYAVLDYTAGYRELRVRFPSIPEAGDLVQADIEVGVHLISGSLTNVKLAVEVDRGGGNYAEITLPTPSPNPGYVGMAFGTGTPPAWGTGGLPANPWQFGDTIARIYFSAAAAGTVLHVYAKGLALRVRPTREIVGDRVAMVPAIVEKRENAPWFAVGWNRQYVYTGTEMVPGTVPIYGPLLGPFAANMEGWADDGSGTDTGVAGALIERAPDIVRLLLRNYGGMSNGDFETGSSTFGSLVKLRAELKTWRGLDMEHAFAVLERTPIRDLIEALAGDSLCWFKWNRFDGKLHGHSWRPGKAPDYARKIPKEWIGGGRITLDRAPGSEVATSVRVPYSLDHVGKNMLQEIMVGPGRSSSGHRWRGIRDQQMTVIASGAGQNNKLDIGTATLDAGDYEPMPFAQHVASKISGLTDQWKVVYGPIIVAGYNDTIPLDTGGGTIVATLNPGDYGTMEALAVEVARAMNAVSSLWSCTYDRATLKFTISRSSGTATLKWETVTLSQTRAAGTLGYDPVHMNGGPHLAHHQREEQRFAICQQYSVDGTFSIPWETGTNGLNAGLKNCAALLGFDSSRNSSTDWSHLAHSPKGNLETSCRLARDQYGGKREWSTPGTTIQDTDTGREIAHRGIHLYSKPRDRIRFASGYIPDMERGRVFEFEANVDDLKCIPGTVVGRAWMVVETEQNAIPESLDTEVVAVEIT
jgi:hypothetical protein